MSASDSTVWPFLEPLDFGELDTSDNDLRVFKSREPIPAKEVAAESKKKRRVKKRRSKGARRVRRFLHLEV